jgi:hypothetical protein
MFASSPINIIIVRVVSLLAIGQRAPDFSQHLTKKQEDHNFCFERSKKE